MMLPVPNESTPLERYTHNLTMLARQGAFSPLSGQDAVISRMFQVLLRDQRRNPVLVDSDEGRRWAVIAEMVRRMAAGDAPEPLCKRQVIALDYEALITNLSDDTAIRQKRREQMFAPLVEKLAPVEQESDEAWWARVGDIPLWPRLEEWIAPSMVLERLQTIFIAMRQSTDSFILFVDHFHRLVGGEWESYPIDAATLLKPALARREVQLIGTCTMDQFRRYIERDAALQRRFQGILLPESAGQ